MMRNIDEIAKEASRKNLEKAGETIKKEETQKEEVKETKNTTEPEKKEVKVEEKKETIFEKLKKKNINVGNEDELEKYVSEISTKVTEYSTKESDYKKQLEEYRGYKEAYEKGYDPLQHFSSLEAYKREQLKKEFPQLTIDVAEQIISGDTSKMSPKELLILDLRIANPTLTQSEVEKVINHKYGIEEEATEIQNILMKSDSSDAINKINALKSKVKEPEKIDLKALQEKQQKESVELKEKLNADWSRGIDQVMFDKFELTDKVDGKEVVLFSQEVEADFKEAHKKEVHDYLVTNKIPVTPEAIEFAKKELNEMYRREHMVKMMKLYAQQQVDKAVEEERKKDQGMGHISRKDGVTKETGHLTSTDKNNMIHGLGGAKR